MNIAVEISAVWPELFMAIAAMAMLMYGAFRGEDSAHFVTWAGVLVLVVAALLVLAGPAGKTTAFNGQFMVDAFAVFTKVLLIAGAALAMILAQPYNIREDIKQFPESSSFVMPKPPKIRRIRITITSSFVFRFRLYFDYFASSKIVHFARIFYFLHNLFSILVHAKLHKISILIKKVLHSLSFTIFIENYRANFAVFMKSLFDTVQFPVYVVTSRP